MLLVYLQYLVKALVKFNDKTFQINQLEVDEIINFLLLTN